MVGERIKLTQVAEPTRELVDKTHAQYVEKLKSLYNGHRHAHEAYAKKELEIW